MILKVVHTFSPPLTGTQTEQQKPKKVSKYWNDNFSYFDHDGDFCLGQIGQNSFVFTKEDLTPEFYRDVVETLEKAILSIEADWHTILIDVDNKKIESYSLPHFEE